MIIAVGFYLVAMYNGLRTRSEGVKRGNSDLAGVMRKRVTLVNQLVDICKGYGEHEKLTHITVSESASGLVENMSAARATNTVIDRVTALAANFPDLKANGTYEKLMDQLQVIETEIQGRREVYNREVESYNTQRAKFPAVFFSEKLGFPEAPYFQTDAEGLETPIVFRTDDGALLRETMKRLGDNATTRGAALARKAGAHIDQIREERKRQVEGGSGATGVSTALPEEGGSLRE